VAIYIVRVECERLTVIHQFPDLASAEPQYEKLRKARPSKYLLLDYVPEGSAPADPPASGTLPRQGTGRRRGGSLTEHGVRPSSAGKPCDVRAVLLKLEYAAFCCRVARTAERPKARLRRIAGAREALRDAKHMASRMEMSEGENLWFQSTLTAVSSELLNEMVRSGE
jgi:hypothetical protein